MPITAPIAVNVTTIVPTKAPQLLTLSVYDLYEYDMALSKFYVLFCMSNTMIALCGYLSISMHILSCIKYCSNHSYFLVELKKLNPRPLEYPCQSLLHTKLHNLISRNL